MKNILSYLTLFPALLISLVVPGCGGSPNETPGKGPQGKPVEVNAVIVAPRELEHKISATGAILANEEVEIRTEIPGRITAINFEEGSIVGKGQVLVKINDAELQAQLRKLLLDEKLAKDDVFRKEKLMELKAISQEELEISLNRLGVVQAEADLIRSQLDKTEIRAPFSGRIGLRYASTGGYVSSSSLITHMLQSDPVKIEFSVPEKYISGINNGDRIQYSISGLDSIFTGMVYAVEPRIDPATRTFTVRARSANPQGILVPGAFARVTIVLEQIKDALVVPAEVVMPDIKGKRIFLARNGQAEMIYVTTGIHTESEVQITGGLAPMDTVIVTGLMMLRDKMPVTARVIEPK